MLRKGIEDIRLLRSHDPRIETQMLDLEPYQPVSRMPPVRCDLSIMVAPETTAEQLGDEVRQTSSGTRFIGPYIAGTELELIETN